jgi:DNA-binding transcriptional regulator YiaG
MDRRTALYRFYALDGALLYIGVSLNYRSRWKQHAANKTWWPQVERRTIEWHDSYPAALLAATAAIGAERPKYNIRHNGPNRTPAPPRPVIREPRWPTKEARALLALVDARKGCTTGENRRIREAAGMPRAAVGAALGVTTAAVAGWETGRRVPRGEPALAYAKLLRSLQKKAA